MACTIRCKKHRNLVETSWLYSSTSLFMPKSSQCYLRGKSNFATVPTACTNSRASFIVKQGTLSTHQPLPNSDLAVISNVDILRQCGHLSDGSFRKMNQPVFRSLSSDPLLEVLGLDAPIADVVYIGIAGLNFTREDNVQRWQRH